MKTILLLMTLLLSGCISENAVLANDKGEKRYCYKTSSGGFSNIGASNHFNKCLNEAGSAGFKRIE